MYNLITMKKLNLMFLSFFILPLSFIACSNGSQQISYLEFKITDGKNLSADESSIVTLRLTPNYEKNILEASYTQDFINNEVKEDLAVNGSFGGENFDRFEKMVNLIGEYNPKETPQTAGVPDFNVELANSSGVYKSIETVDSEATVDPDVEKLRSFYLDISRLLTEDEQV